jgi:hypothetical protein
MPPLSALVAGAGARSCCRRPRRLDRPPGSGIDSGRCLRRASACQGKAICGSGRSRTLMRRVVGRCERSARAFATRRQPLPTDATTPKPAVPLIPLPPSCERRKATMRGHAGRPGFRRVNPAGPAGMPAVAGGARGPCPGADGTTSRPRGHREPRRGSARDTRGGARFETPRWDSRWRAGASRGNNVVGSDRCRRLVPDGPPRPGSRATGNGRILWLLAS